MKTISNNQNNKNQVAKLSLKEMMNVRGGTRGQSKGVAASDSE